MGSRGWGLEIGVQGGTKGGWRGGLWLRVEGLESDAARGVPRPVQCLPYHCEDRFLDGPASGKKGSKGGPYK